MQAAILPARLVDSKTLKFEVQGRPLRVFDQCPRGLMEVPFRRVSSTAFCLEQPPAGDVWAEVNDQPGTRSPVQPQHTRAVGRWLSGDSVNPTFSHR